LESHFPSHSDFLTQTLHLLSRSEAGPEEQKVPADWNVGDVILGLYRVQAILGEGGMGRVYKVRHRGWGVNLAVKSPKPALLERSGGVERFEQECETWINLGLHPYVVSCYYVRRLGGIPRIFAECVDGPDGFTAVRDRTLYADGYEKATERILQIAVQAAWGLHHAHEHGVIHRDVKTHNFLLTQNWTGKVTDFGLAEAMAQDVDGPSDGTRRKGGMTPAFCSPEQFAHEQVDHRTDVWSWALCVLHMFSGKVNWKLGTEGEAILDHCLKSGPADEVIPPMPRPVIELLRACLQVDRDKRPADMIAVADGIQEAYSRLSGMSFPYEAPKSVDAVAHSLNNRAVSLMDLGKAEEAMGLWETALKTEAHLPQAVYNLGLVSWRAGRLTDEALLQKLRDVMELHSNRLLPYFQMVQVLLERGDAEGAIDLLGQIEQRFGKRRDISEAMRRADSSVASSRRLAHRIEAHADGVKAVIIDADGTHALSASEDNTIKLWSLPDGHLVRTYKGHQGSVETLSATADGRYILSAAQDRSMRLWERSSGTCVYDVDVSREATRAAAISPDAKFAVTRHVNNTLAVWDLSSGDVVRETAAHTDWINAICIFPDGQRALSAGQDGTVMVWDLDVLQPIRELTGHDGAVNAVAVSLNGDYALSGGADRILRLWEVASGKCLRMMRGHRETVTSVALSGDARFALSGGLDDTVRFWFAAGARCLRTFDDHTADVTSVSLPREGTLAVSGGLDNAVNVWELGDRASFFLAPYMLCRTQGSEATLSLGMDFKKALNRAREAYSAGDAIGAAKAIRKARQLRGYARHKDALKMWQRLYPYLPRRSLLGMWEGERLRAHDRGVNSLCTTRDGKTLLSAGADGSVNIWDTAQGVCTKMLKGHTAAVKSIVMTADGRICVSGGEDQAITLWDAEDGEPLVHYEGVAGSVESLDLSPEGLFLLSGGWDMRLWETAEGRPLLVYDGHDSDIVCVRWSPDGRLAISGSSDETVRVWRARDGECLHVLSGHSGVVRALAVTPNGRYIVSASSNMWGRPGRVRIWDIETGEALGVMEGHESSVNTVIVTQDSRYIFSGGADAAIRLWDIQTGECIRVFQGHSTSVTSLSLSPDSRYLASGDAEGIIQMWSLDWELAEQAPAPITEAMTPYLTTWLVNRQNLVGGLPDDRSPTVDEVARALDRTGRPEWTDEDLATLLYDLGCAGFGRADRSALEEELSRLGAKMGRRSFFGRRR